MSFKKFVSAVMSAVLFLTATGCTAEARNNKAREEMEDAFGSYMDRVLAGKDASKSVDAKKEAEYDVTPEQNEILRCVLKNAEYEIDGSEADAKDKEGTVTVKLKYADAEEFAGSYFDDELEDLLDELENCPKTFYVKKKIKVDLVGTGDGWLVTKKSDAKLKKELQSIVDDICLEPYYPIETKPTDTKPSGSVKVGISLPTKDLQRWASDGERMRSGLEDLGYEVDLRYAGNSTDTQYNQVKELIDSGCSVLIIASIDPASLENAANEAKEKGVWIIAYDRIINDTDAVDFFVTFDNYLVGVMQASYIIDKLQIDDSPEDRVFNIEFTCGDPSDYNALFFYNGAHDVFAPYIESGKVRALSDQHEFRYTATDSWSTGQAQTRAEAIIDFYYSDGETIDAWLCSNDSTALGVTNALEAKYTGPYPVVTGQDCDITNVKNIINGRQSMSVFKDTRVLADRAVTMVDQILKNQTVDYNDSERYYNGMKTLDSYLCEPVIVDADNYRAILIDSGYYTEDMLN